MRRLFPYLVVVGPPAAAAALFASAWMGAAGPRAAHYLLLLLMLEFVTIVGGAFCARLAQARAPFGFVLLALPCAVMGGLIWTIAHAEREMWMMSAFGILLAHKIVGARVAPHACDARAWSLAVGVLLAATGLTLLVTPWVYACGLLYFTAMSVILTVFLSRPPLPAPDPVPVTEPLTRNPMLK